MAGAATMGDLPEVRKLRPSCGELLLETSEGTLG